MSLIALLIAGVVAYCEVSIARLRCSEAVVMGTHQSGHSGSPACYRDPFCFFLWMRTSRQGSSVSSEGRGIHSKLHDLYCSRYRSLHLLWEASKLNPACVFDFFPALSSSGFPPFYSSYLLSPFSLMCSLSCKAIQV